MLISEFVKKYNDSKQKKAFVEKHITSRYIPYERKISLSEMIVEKSMYKEVNKKKEFVINSPVRYSLFIQSIIDEYTDLEWDEKDKDTTDILRDFNMLEENGVIEILMAAIGEDVGKFTTVLNLIVDDQIDINRSMVPFLETKFEAISMTLNAVSNAIEAPEIKKKIAQYIK